MSQKDTNGCPLDRENTTSIHWSGGIVEADFFFTGGFQVLAQIESTEMKGFPARQAIRCDICQRVWDLENRLWDRPPLLCFGKLIDLDQEEAYIKDFKKGLFIS